MNIMKRSLSWFEFGLALFAGALPVGLVLLVAAPFDFFHAMGAVILAMGVIGLWLSSEGLRLERPERWAELRDAVLRRHGRTAHARTAASVRAAGGSR